MRMNTSTCDGPSEELLQELFLPNGGSDDTIE